MLCSFYFVSNIDCGEVSCSNKGGIAFFKSSLYNSALHHHVVLNKVNKMAHRSNKSNKAPARPFYNHSQRPAVTRQITSIPSTSGRHNVAVTSSLVDVPPARPRTPNDDHMDVDFDQNEDDMPGLLEVEDSDVEVDEVPGIKVRPKIRAKRYVNSVRLLFNSSFAEANDP